MLNIFKGTKSLAAAAVIVAFTATGCGLIPTQADSAITSVNVSDTKLAIKGYDPVAYFTESKAVQGVSAHTAQYQGATYLFSSAANKSMFEGDPAKYAPQYGGYCAFGVSKEKKFDIDPEAFAVVDGKLYLNLNKKVQSRWVLNTEELISDANEYWTVIADTPAEAL
jgi:YHS domain-containing protein